MHNHSKVQAGDLSRLERAVRSATKKAEGARHHHHQQQQTCSTSRTTATPRSAATPRSTGASTYRSAASSRGGGSLPTHRTLLSQRGSPVQQQTAKSGNALESSRSRSRPRPSTAGSVTSRSREQQRQHHAQHQGGRRKLLSSRGSGRSDEHVAAHLGDGGVPNSIKNEWLILDTYQQLMADEKHAEEDCRAQAGALFVVCDV